MHKFIATALAAGSLLSGASHIAHADYVPIPDLIQAEDYDAQSGIRTGDTNDSGGSEFVGWIHNGDYTEYDIDVPAAGSYKLDARVASLNKTAEVIVSADGGVVGSFTVTATGDWDSWKTVNTTLQLTAGDTKLRLEYTGSSGSLMNINWLSLESADTSDNPDNDDDSEYELDRSNWRAGSNNGRGNAYRAIDGNDNSRWTTRANQTNGQVFQVDMKSSQNFDRIILETEKHPSNYPRSYEVEISDNESNWSEVASGAGNSNGATVIDFDGKNARYIRITQLGSSNSDWWSIHEIRVFGNTDTESTPSDWNISSLEELRDAIQSNNQDLTMRPGNYNMTELSSNSRNLIFSGSNNTVDMTGVYIDVPVGSTEKESYIQVLGDDNELIGATFEDTYNSGLVEVTDFVSYNNDRDNHAYGLSGNAVMDISGDDNLIDGFKLTVRGSYPYGYGSIFGIGSDNSVGLDKRCSIVIKGDGNTIDNTEVQQRAFCHGIYMQDEADNTTIRNTLVEGRVRETNDMLAEGSGSLPEQENYMTFEGEPIPANEVNSLSEDGLRTYGGTGSVVVENSVVKNMRGGIRLYLGSEISVTDSISTGSGLANFTLGANDSISNTLVDFTNGPASDFRLSRNRQTIDVTVLPSPDAIGAHNIMDVSGDGHSITLRRYSGPEDTRETRVISVDGNDSTIRNETEYGIVLESGTSGNTVVSAGPVTDRGSNNVTRIDLDL